MPASFGVQSAQPRVALDASNVAALGQDRTTLDTITADAYHNVGADMLKAAGAGADLMRVRRQNQLTEQDIQAKAIDNAYGQGVLDQKISTTNKVLGGTEQKVPSDVAATIASNENTAVQAGYQTRIVDELVKAGVPKADAAAKASQAGAIASEADFLKALGKARLDSGLAGATVGSEISGKQAATALDANTITAAGSANAKDFANKGVTLPAAQSVLVQPGAIGLASGPGAAPADLGRINASMLGVGKAAGAAARTEAAKATKEEEEAVDALTTSGGNEQLQALMTEAKDNGGKLTGSWHASGSAANQFSAKSPYAKSAALAKEGGTAVGNWTGSVGDADIARAVTDQNRLGADAVTATLAGHGAKYAAPAAARTAAATQINSVFPPLLQQDPKNVNAYQFTPGALAPAQRAELVKVVDSSVDGDPDAMKKAVAILKAGYGNTSDWLVADAKGRPMLNKAGETALNSIRSSLMALRNSGAEAVEASGLSNIRGRKAMMGEITADNIKPAAAR